MDLHQAARWNEKSDKEIASLEKHGVFKLVPIASNLVGLKVVSTLWVLKIKVKVPTRVDSSSKGFRRSLARTPPE